MKKAWLIILVFLLIPILVSCQTPAATTTPQAAQPAVTSAPVTTASPAKVEIVLTLSDINGKSKDFTLDEVKKLPVTEGQAGIKSSTGKITPPSQFKGVLLADLMKAAGGLDSSMGIQIEAKDGYAMTFSADQVIKGDFIAYDPATGDEIKPDGKLQALIAYEMDGKPLDTERDGYLRLVVVSDKNNQVTDGHWSVKWVRKITTKPLAVEWTLPLEGAITDSVDRGTFESCSTSKCHQASWKDDKAQTWTGTPLWLLVGRVDDDKKHNDDAFNKDLAKKGYTVEVVAKDGYSVVFDVARLIDNKNIIVADQVNGNPLSDKDFPLRLVGSDVGKKEGVGAIAKIILHLNDKPAAVQATPTAAAAPASDKPLVLPEGKALMATGLVESEKTWTMDELKKMEVVQLKVEHPKKGPQSVEGVRLNALLDLLKLKSDAKTITFTAVDGFTASASVKDIQACKDCLVAFNEANKLKLAMPGLESTLWVKDLIAITVK
jgi:DMSO/TMAO reductase YedYZ molybdopterin-dependent catalytic subunit